MRAPIHLISTPKYIYDHIRLSPEKIAKQIINIVGKCGKITCLSFGGTMCVPQKVHISKTNTFNQRKLMTKPVPLSIPFLCKPRLDFEPIEPTFFYILHVLIQQNDRQKSHLQPRTAFPLIPPPCPR